MKKTTAEEYSAEKIIEHPAYSFGYIEEENVAIFLDDNNKLYFLNMPDMDALNFGDMEDTQFLFTEEEVPTDIVEQAKLLLQQ